MSKKQILQENGFKIFIHNSLYREYELKILRISVELAYLGIYFTEKHAKRRLTWLTVLMRFQHSSSISNFRAEHCKNY